MPFRPELEAVLTTLKARGPASLSLDDLADALAPHNASYDEVEAAIDDLEADGVLVDAPDSPDLPAELGRVLTAARALGTELGRTARVEEIAARAGLSEADVQRALRYARVVSR